MFLIRKPHLPAFTKNICLFESEKDLRDIVVLIWQNVKFSSDNHILMLKMEPEMPICTSYLPDVYFRCWIASIGCRSTLTKTWITWVSSPQARSMGGSKSFRSCGKWWIWKPKLNRKQNVKYQEQIEYFRIHFNTILASVTLCGRQKQTESGLYVINSLPLFRLRKFMHHALSPLTLIQVCSRFRCYGTE